MTKALDILRIYNLLNKSIRQYKRNSNSQFDNPYAVKASKPLTENEFKVSFINTVKNNLMTQEELKKRAQPININHRALYINEFRKEFNDMEFYSAVLSISKGEFKSLEEKKTCFECLLSNTLFNKGYFYINKQLINNKIYHEIKSDINTKKIILEILITLINMYKFTVEISEDKMITKPGELQDLTIFTQIEKEDFEFPRILEISKQHDGNKVYSLDNLIGFEVILFLTSFFDEMNFEIRLQNNN